MATSVFRDVDRGAKALLKRLRAARDVRVRVGIYGDRAAEKAIDGKGLTVGQIANAHERGLGPPERPWFRKSIDGNMAWIKTGLRGAAAAVVKGEIEPGPAILQAGLAIAGRVKETIVAGVSPPLGHSPGSLRYLREKLEKYPGATTALIASSQMLQSVAAGLEERGQ